MTYKTGIQKRELTAFVREVVLPGAGDEKPVVDPQHCAFRLESRRSPIHRWGIFTTEPIPARRRVIEYTGQRIGRAEVFRRRFRQHIYIHWLPTGRAIDGAIGGSGAEYLNHSCVPNLIARCTRTRIFLTSLRPIAAGEELFFDYRIANNGYDIPCKCGHPDCIGVLNPVR